MNIILGAHGGECAPLATVQRCFTSPEGERLFLIGPARGRLEVGPLGPPRLAGDLRGLLELAFRP